MKKISIKTFYNNLLIVTLYLSLLMFFIPSQGQNKSISSEKNPNDSIPTYTLNETIVTAVRAAIIAKQDTLEYNAESFHTSPNATVAELLKKLPGVEIGSDGVITSNGKNISKILVDGKEFFSDDPQIATKNLPSEMVDKVQVIDRKSDFARQTGVDDGEEETVINLTVKKNMKESIFGNINLGYGTDNRYNGSFIINSFKNGNQVSLLGGLNNINENGFSDRGRFRDFGGDGGISNAQRLGMNFNIGKDEYIRFGGNIFYSHTSKYASKRSSTTFLYPDSTTVNNVTSQSRDRVNNISSDFRLQWNIDENNIIDFRPRFSFNFRESTLNDSSILSSGDYPYNSINLNRNKKNNKGNSKDLSGTFIYTHKFSNHPGRNLSISVQYSYSDIKQKSITWNNIEYYLLSGEFKPISRLLDNDNISNFAELKATWLEPMGRTERGNFLSFSYKLKYQWNDGDQLTYNLDIPDTTFFNSPLINYPSEGTEYDPLFSNRFRNRFSNQELQIGYKKVRHNLNIETGFLFAPSSSKSIDFINKERNIPIRWVYNISPYINVRYKFTDHISLRANYRARTSQPSLSQLQPVANVSDPLNVIIGNPVLKPTFTQNIGMHFNSYNPDSQQSIAAMFNTSFALNSIVANTISNSETGGRITSYRNVNGNFNIFIMAMLARPFSNRKWRFDSRLNIRFSSVPGYINGYFNRTGNLNLSPSMGITFSSDLFQGNFSPHYSLGSISNTLSEQPDRLNHSYGFSSYFSLYLPFGLEISSDLSFYATKGYGKDYDSDQWLWNAQISYSFLSDKSLTLSVKGYDILAMKKNIVHLINANSIIDAEYNDLSRFFMLCLTWNFNTMRKK